MVITNWKFYGTPDSPLLQPILPDGHDYGVSREPEKFAEIFEQMPNSRFIGFNEYIGYLHASNSGFWDKKLKKIELHLDYDPHYATILPIKKVPGGYSLQIGFSKKWETI